MNKYNGLLSTISQQYHILKGQHESDNAWKVRLIYSICGMMAYASLWDDADELISVVHLKRRISRMLLSYRSMYSELSAELPFRPNELEDEIFEQFVGAGVVYHRPNRIIPSMKREESFYNILFQRGIALDSISYVSGIGFYSKQEGSSDLNRIKEMFALEQENLYELWQTILSHASWKFTSSFGQYTEYLRMKPPFKYGYWVNEPDKTGVVSILRTGMQDSRIYYLYRYTSSRLEISPLPQWRVESYNYRTLACACLSTYGTLPPIEYSSDGALVHIHQKYLLPPRELTLLKLYSWPETCVILPCDFNRKLCSDVFIAIMNILVNEGYFFKEVLPDDSRGKFCS